ncbi:MAG: methionine--tRNA ligase subunit beta, partial [Clostridia bacterium]|nr:methionine--tRNA ligase subunit beta [Clostridia bacterium]
KQPVKAEKKEEVAQIGIEDFSKVQLVACKVLECEAVPKSDKLLRLIVDDGEGKRQVVSGIAKFYKPDELIGKTLVLVANLTPAKLRGVESCGMILASGGETVKLVELDDSVAPGTRIS